MNFGTQIGRERLPVRLLAMLWLLVSAALIWSSWPQVGTLAGWDPDDELRLVQLRDFLNGQSWFDTTQYRMNRPNGAPIHWSRLVEVPLALLILLLRPLMGQMWAEIAAGIAVPLLLLGWISYMLARIATQISSREAGVAAALITLSSGALLLQLRPMRIDHHGWQIAMAVLALSTLFRADVRKAGIVLGLAMAVWLHISLEGAPMTAAFFLFLGFGWVRGSAVQGRLFWTITSFTVCTVLLFFGTQAQGLYADTYCDTISPPHMFGIASAAFIMIPATYLQPDRWEIRLAAAALAGGLALVLLLSMAPQCVGGAFGGMDPLVRTYWYSNVTEGLPIWHQPWRVALNLSAGLVAGTISWFLLSARLRGEPRRQLATMGFFVFFGVLLSLLVVRTISVATAFAIPVTASFIALLFRQYRQAKVPARRIGLIAAILVLLVPGAAISSLIRILPDGANDSTAEAKNKAADALCQSALSIRALGSLPKGNFLSTFDMGPTILAQTPHSVLASSHHRNEQAMHDHIQIFRSSPDTSHQLLKARGIDYLALCPAETELAIYARKDPGGLWAQLAKGKIPQWLEPLGSRGKGIKVWRVR
ncbi:hypothetical protein EUU23_11405 [Sphingorhabdus sp. IMCC26285]|uniref:AcrB/AcrD/AcrF family protein n=1 Tax=Sphingorhabdus profundilacus TaxID=2509718 RepID=A0A6I4M2V3_9SPHN|nr:hypothetical protein [Sphingorhabdus profundilacus]MVZ98300.1 hypothetical protein [Sphingorhabdus profundilacus]